MVRTIFGKISEANIVVDMIVQNVATEGTTVAPIGNAATVNAPVAGFALYASYATGCVRLRWTCPTSFIASWAAGRFSSVLTSTP